jgi:hypothetical protein
MTSLFPKIRTQMRIPYALRHVPHERLASLLPCPAHPGPGDIALARLEKIGKNARYELADGRAADLHEDDLLAVVFGNRYATEQFEGHAAIDGEACDLLSMGGMCGLVISKHASIAEPSRVRVLGALGDADGRPLRLRDFALPMPTHARPPHITVVCGTSMDAGKTFTAMSLILGLRRMELEVAGIKLTGTVTGRDTWRMRDAGAKPALDFVDGGLPSTYLCELHELLDLHQRLLGVAAAAGASHAVIEIADGLLQRETAMLLQSPAFTQTVDAWVLAAGDPLGAFGALQVLRKNGIEPVALSGLLTLSPLAMREAAAATGLQCLTAKELQCGALNQRLTRTSRINGTNGFAHDVPRLAAEAQRHR